MIERESRTKVLIGPDGGTLEVENERGDTIALEIPPRAFEESRYITMTALRSPPTDIFGYNIFPGVVIEPDGLVLHRPARLQVLLKDPLPHPELSGLFWVVSGTQVRGIAGQRSSDQLIGGEVYHFSPYTGAQLTLSEAVYWAEVLAGMDPARRSDLPLPPLDGPLADFMVTWTDVTSLLQLDQMFQTLTGDSRYRELAESLLEEGILAFLSKPAPKNRCSLYHEYLSRLSDLAAPLLTDPGVNQLLAERVADVDEECITSIAGNWQIESISPEEICRAPALEFTGEYGEEGSSIDVTINQTGSSLSASSVDYPENGVLHGRLQATGDEAVPYSLDLSIEGADSPDCLAFFAGEEDDFGYPVCAGQPGCRPISCYETYLASAEVSWNGLALSGMAVWTFTATVRVPDPDGGYKRVTYSCLGAAGLTGTKQLDCQDLNPCTEDSYVPGAGCVHQPITGTFNFDPYDCFKTQCQNGYAVGIEDDSEVPPQDSPNDCEKRICDFGYNWVIVADVTETPPYEPNNCRHEVCGPYGVEYQVDNTDLPVQESPYDCLRNVCQLGEPISVPDDSETPLPAADGTPRVCRNGVAAPVP